MCLKKYDPYKCFTVPVGELVLFAHKNSELCHRVYTEWGIAFADTRNAIRGNRLARWRAYYKSDLVNTFKAFILLEFNYMDCYLKRDFIFRFIKVYRKHVLKDNGWF